MKVFIKTLKGTHFEIEAEPNHLVADVKKSIETVQGPSVYPASQQLLIFKGKILKDDTTLEDNQVLEKSFIVIMLTKTKSSPGEGSAAAAPVPGATSTAQTTTTAPAPAAAPTTVATPVPNTPTPPPMTGPGSTPAQAVPPAMSQSDVYGQAASNLVAGSNSDSIIQEILDVGGGAWDRDTVVLALRAAFNNPDRAIEYLYSGIPAQAEVPPVAQASRGVQPTNPSLAPQQPAQPQSVPSSGPNADPLNLFPQGLPNLGSGANPATSSLDFLRNNDQFQALQAMVQSNPEILQPMLQELGKQNPQLIRLIQQHQDDFLRLLNEPVEGVGGEAGDILGDIGAQSVEVTPVELEAVERLEAMGFNRETVLQVYFACNKNEELAANYLLDHMNELED